MNIKDNTQSYIANKICFDADSEVWQSINTIDTLKCESTSKIINQTICREKTEVEKLMNEDCKELINNINRHKNCWFSAPNNFKRCKTLMWNEIIAWRKKGCET